MGITANSGLTKARNPQQPAQGQEQDFNDLSKQSLNSTAVEQIANPVLNAQGRSGFIANAIGTPPPTEIRTETKVAGGRDAATTRSDYRSSAQNAVIEGSRAYQYALEQGATLEEAAAAKSHAETFVTASGREENELQRQREQAQAETQTEALSEDERLGEKRGENSPRGNKDRVGIEIAADPAAGRFGANPEREALSIDIPVASRDGAARTSDLAVEAAIDDLFRNEAGGARSAGLEQSLAAVRQGRDQFVRDARFEQTRTSLDRYRSEFGQQESAVAEFLPDYRA
jgi:hypothetical protein